MENVKQNNSNRVNKSSNDIKLSITAGLLISFVISIFFVFMQVTGFAEELYMRGVNLIILGLGIFLMLGYYSAKNKDQQLKYLRGIKLGSLTTIFAMIPFTLIVLFYLLMNPDFVEHVKQTVPFGSHLNTFAITAFVLIEGVVSGLILTYILMPMFKKESVVDL